MERQCGGWSCTWATVSSGLAALLLAAALPALAEESWKFGPGLGVSSGKADFRFTLTGYIQGDVRGYPNWDVIGEDLRNGETEIRRLRVGAELEWRRLYTELDVDLVDDDEHLKDAYGEIRISKAFRARGGNFKPPLGPEFLTPARKLDFVDRSLLASNLTPQRDWGGELHGQVDKRLLYQVGVFGGDGRKSVRSTGAMVAARLVLTPAGGFDLGVSFTQGDVEPQPDASGEPVPKGMKGEAHSGYVFFERKFVNGRRRRLDAEASFLRGPVGLKGEWLEEREQRLEQGPTFEDLPDVFGRGWSVSGTWLLTGEKKKPTIKPRRPLFQGPGAVEIGARYEELRFDDRGPDTGFAGVGNRSRNIRPAGDRAFTGGLSWWPVQGVRLTGNVVIERFEDPLLAPEPGRNGNYLTLQGRLQLELP